MKELFGITQGGQEIYRYTVQCGSLTARIINYGAILQGLDFCGRNIVGGFDTLEAYLNDDSHQGGIIGRVANRIGGAAFIMDSTEYRVSKNDGENTLHGGEGFDRRVWEVRAVSATSVTLSYCSCDGEEGFPARLDVTVRYTVADGELRIDYTALPHGKTPIALTNHAYFNLDGFGADILNHSLKIYADSYTELDGALIATGRRIDVKGTPYDFTDMRRIGDRISSVGIGYDNNYILRDGGGRLRLACEVENRDTRMQLYTDCEGVQLYTGNFLGKGHSFSGGIRQIKHGALCLEAQSEPGAISRGEIFYGEGEIYQSTTIYKLERLT